MTTALSPTFSHAALAATPPPTLPAQAPRSCLSFRLGAEEYGIELLAVQEIRRLSEPTRLAGAPAHVRGVIELRGLMVPLVDLRLKLGLPARDDEATVVIIVNLERGVVGMVVDAVNEVVELRPGQLRPAPALGAGGADFIEGLAPLADAQGERLLIVADVERLVGRLAATRLLS